MLECQALNRAAAFVGTKGERLGCKEGMLPSSGETPSAELPPALGSQHGKGMDFFE